MTIVWAGARARVLVARATGSPAAASLVGGLPELYDLDIDSRSGNVDVTHTKKKLESLVLLVLQRPARRRETGIFCRGLGPKKFNNLKLPAAALSGMRAKYYN